VRHPENLIAGYYLNSPCDDNIAVLSIANFVTSDGGPSQAAFQHTSREFLRLAKAANKTKLILDLRGNPGGTILQAFDLFKQLFPHLSPWGGSRFRAFDTLDAIGQQISFLSDAYYDSIKTNDNSTASASVTYQQAAMYEPFNPRLDTTAQSDNFPNWSALYGPVPIPGRDTFTHLIRYNLSSPILLAGLGFNITTDHSSPANSSTLFSSFSSPDDETPFARSTDDIIMLHDGLCTSTCATFADMLRVQAGVRSVVMGGRPPAPPPPSTLQQQRQRHSAAPAPAPAPAQAVGGTRGMEVYSFDYIYELIRFVWGSGTEADRAVWNGTMKTTSTTTITAEAVAGPATKVAAAPDLGSVSTEPMRRWGRAGWGTVNVRDSVLLGAEGYLDGGGRDGSGSGGDEDGDGVPSQFLWVPADCRLWYTPEMVVFGRGVSEVWAKVGRVAWGSGGLKGEEEAGCVVGEF
jgi:Peptidase family S41